MTRRRLLVFAAALMLMVGFLPVWGMGDNPSTCSNLYPATVTAFTIHLQNGSTYNLLTHPNLTLAVRFDQSYNASFTLKAATESTNNNTQPGSVFFDSNWLGYSDGVCANGSGSNFVFPQTPSVLPSQSVTILMTATEPNNFGGAGAHQPVLWTLGGTAKSTPASQASYSINWTPDVTTVTQSTTVTSTSTASITVSATSTATSTVDITQSQTITATMTTTATQTSAVTTTSTVTSVSGGGRVNASSSSSTSATLSSSSSQSSSPSQLASQSQSQKSSQSTTSNTTTTMSRSTGLTSGSSSGSLSSSVRQASSSSSSLSSSSSASSNGNITGLVVGAVAVIAAAGIGTTMFLTRRAAKPSA